MGKKRRSGFKGKLKKSVSDRINDKGRRQLDSHVMSIGFQSVQTGVPSIDDVRFANLLLRKQGE